MGYLWKCTKDPSAEKEFVYLFQASMRHDCSYVTVICFLSVSVLTFVGLSACAWPNARLLVVGGLTATSLKTLDWGGGSSGAFPADPRFSWQVWT